MRTRYYVDVVGGIVVAKRAVGPARDGSYPTPPAGWVQVSAPRYHQLDLGWRRTVDGWEPPEPEGDEDDPVRRDSVREQFWRKEARLRLKLRELEQRIVALEQG